MYVRAIIQARMLSSRLRGKSLLSVAGTPLLYRVIQSVKSFSFIDDIVIATTKAEADDPIVAAANDLGIKIFRGDSLNVLKRFNDASADLGEEDLVIRFTADNPLYNNKIGEVIFQKIVNGNYDYACVEGLSHIVPEFIRVRVLRETCLLAQTDFEKEHVTPFIRKNGDVFKLLTVPENFEGLRQEADKYLTIDTENDLLRFEKMFDALQHNKSTQITLKNIYDWIDAFEKTITEGNEFIVNLNGVLAGDDKPVFIIAEIGQNHNGDMQIAKDLIDMAIRCGADAVKLQKRDMQLELTAAVYNAPYENPHSFGKTYGEHREFLELSEEQHAALKQYANEKGMTYFCTPCDIPSVEVMERIHVPFYKVASRDLTNLPLLERIARTKKPVIISTGMGSEQEIKEALQTLGEERKDIIIMHCISQYPADIDNVNLRAIQTLRKTFKTVTGYSDHTTGIITPVVAATMGAAVIEKHITLSRAMKGTDHAGSLEETGLKKMIEYIRLMERALGDGVKEIHPASKFAKEKLARSITSKTFIKAGTIITEDMLTLKSPGTGMKWNERNKIIRKKAKRNIEIDTTLSENDFA